MVVEYIAVRCFSCNTFQVQQQKKKNEFQCRVCGQKQSVRKVYARSYKAADIRPLVQEYNMRRGEKEEQEVETKKYEIQKKLEINRINQFDNLLGEDFDEVSAGSDAQNPTQNKWHQFIDNDDDVEENLTESNNDLVENSKYDNEIELITELPKRSRQIFRRKSKKIDKQSESKLQTFSQSKSTSQSVNDDGDEELFGSCSQTLQTKRKSVYISSQQPTKAFKYKDNSDITSSMSQRKTLSYCSTQSNSSNNNNNNKNGYSSHTVTETINDSNDSILLFIDELEAMNSNTLQSESFNKQQQQQQQQQQQHSSLTTTKSSMSLPISNYNPIQGSTLQKSLEEKQQTEIHSNPKPKPSFWDQFVESDEEETNNLFN